ncbi:MAG: hypothetical protein LBN00_11475 [Oscillospiraceae bacterium]|jgi:hypothetical protein|nr:hypothetical protein [Oscillospiraceae bacterium]
MIIQKDYTFLMEHVSFLNDFTANEVLLWTRCIVNTCFEQGTQLRNGNIGSNGMIIIKSGVGL